MSVGETLFLETVQIGMQYFIEKIQFLLYKDNPDVFDLIDFDDENIYQEPLLFAQFCFPDKSNLTLENLLYGYMQTKLRPKEMIANSDDFGRIYLANFGWVITSINKQEYTIKTLSNFDIELYIKDEKVAFTLEPLCLLEEGGPEIIKYPINVLKACHPQVSGVEIELDITEITKERIQQLKNAWRLMKQLIPAQYELTKKIVNKMVVFNLINGTGNSFATTSANGTAFFHCYQPEYNEVFFIDDIAHQTGHVIFYAITAEPEHFIKLLPETLLQSFTDKTNQGTRTVYILFHALYTYYVTLIFLNKALEMNSFRGQKLHESRGRICFYINKYRHDITFLKECIGLDALFTDKGRKLYDKIETDLTEINNNWYQKLNHLDLTNQPYNFTYSKFIELNPIEKVHQ
ncbi:MAG: hypothetical protein GQ574_17720 [Crocinitomix sp.]|nr:hypothetical protein [Crocinitomix sp.]